MGQSRRHAGSGRLVVSRISDSRHPYTGVNLWNISGAPCKPPDDDGRTLVGARKRVSSLNCKDTIPHIYQVRLAAFRPIKASESLEPNPGKESSLLFLRFSLRILNLCPWLGLLSVVQLASKTGATLSGQYVIHNH